MSTNSVIQLSLVQDQPRKIDDLRARLTDELIIAFVGPIGSGCSTSATIVQDTLISTYGYEEVLYHKISDLIIEATPLLSEPIDLSAVGPSRVKILQKAGNELRKKFNDDYLAAKIIEKIASDRLSKDGFDEAEDGSLIPKPKRWAHIIDSIKNPSELGLLREVYGDMLWVFGVFSPEQKRKDRLEKIKRWDQREVNELMLDDFQQEWHYGQGVRDTFFQADFFIRNDGDNDERLKNVISRHLEVIFAQPVRTPTVEESAMYSAYSAASRSACLSRQVGAAIVSQTKETIGVGWNDVPKYNGGLYSHEDSTDDNRCYKWGEKVCHNDKHKVRLYKEIYDVLLNDGLLKEGSTLEDSINSLKRTDVKQLIEFSRAVHAEMAALISVARNSKAGLAGATLFCTTFPCHSCARHIVAAGITKVVYIEPYPKSLANDLHRDSVSISQDEANKKVLLEQYEGVAPRNLLRLFKPAELLRKNKGALIDFQPKKAHPLGSVSVDDFSTHEKRVLAKLKNIEAA